MSIANSTPAQRRSVLPSLGALLLLSLAAGCGPSTWMATSPSAPWKRGDEARFLQRVERDPFPTASQSGLKAATNAESDNADDTTAAVSDE